MFPPLNLILTNVSWLSGEIKTIIIRTTGILAENLSEEK